jgi:SAM-dependent methyltransferase
LICPGCKSEQTVLVDVLYHQCSVCKTITATHEIDPETENDNPDSRSRPAALQARLHRVTAFVPNPITAADVGCGRGELVRFLTDKGIHTIGCDKNTAVKFEDLAPQCFDLVFAVEVIEHFADPVQFLHDAFRAVRPGGVLYVETSFADRLGPYWRAHPYVDARIGHRCILSSGAFVVTCYELSGVYGVHWVDQNVAIIQKAHK